MLPSLQKSPINLLSLREQYRRNLLQIIDQYPGSKAIVIDSKLRGAMGVIERNDVLKVRYRLGDDDDVGTFDHCVRS